LIKQFKPIYLSKVNNKQLNSSHAMTEFTADVAMMGHQ